MVVSQSSFLPLPRPQSLESSSLPPDFLRVPGCPFVTSLRPYFIPLTSLTQDRPQPQPTQSLAHAFHHLGVVPPCTPIFEFPISNFVSSTATATPLFATLTDHPQLHENKAALSLVFATLTGRVKHKSCVCHSYEKHRGVAGRSPKKQIKAVYGRAVRRMFRQRLPLGAKCRGSRSNVSAVRPYPLSTLHWCARSSVASTRRNSGNAWYGTDGYR